MAKTSGIAAEQAQGAVEGAAGSLSDTGQNIEDGDILEGIVDRSKSEADSNQLDTAGYATGVVYGNDGTVYQGPTTQAVVNQHRIATPPAPGRSMPSAPAAPAAAGSVLFQSDNTGVQSQVSTNLEPKVERAWEQIDDNKFIDSTTGEDVTDWYLANLSSEELQRFFEFANSSKQGKPNTPKPPKTPKIPKTPKQLMAGMQIGDPQAVQQARLQQDLEALNRQTPDPVESYKTPKHPEAPRSYTERQALDRIFANYEDMREDSATDRDINTYNDYAQWRRNNPGKSPNEYFNAIRPQLDSEHFYRETKLSREKKGNLEDYSREIKQKGLRSEAEENVVLETEKDRRKYDHLIMQTKIDIKKGFFHVETEHVEKDENGNEYARWSDDVEQEIVAILRFVNRPNTIKNQRDIMRSVRLYASMSVDRQGKMFNEDADQWELSEAEMISILRLMRRSCIERGTPFAIVDSSFELRETKVFPCGVMPKTVADFWTAPGSNLLNEDGSPMSAAQLVQRTQDEWNQRTRPALVAYAPIEQRIVIEDMMRAVSMLDGMSAERFSERYGVRSEVDYMISEWQDSNAAYAAAMNDYFDATAVQKRQDAMLDMYRKSFDRQRGSTYVYDESGQLEAVMTSKQPGWISSLKLASKLMRSASVGLNIPVITSAFAEHGVGNLYTAMTIVTLNRMYGTNHRVSQFTIERFKSDEALEAFQCVKELYDTFGPGATRLFSESGLPYTKENVLKFAAENLKPSMGETAEMFSQKMDKFTHTLMVADYAFKRSDMRLWLDAYFVTNAIMARSQQKMKDSGEMSKREAPLTPEEIESAVRASDMGRFFAQAMGTDAGINAYQMMRANNIGQKSPMSEFAKQFLDDHAVTNFAITAFVDTFPQYGINFAYMLVPFSRTMSYLKAHSDFNPETGRSDLLIGGNIEDFQLGLRMNLIYDAFTFGGRSVIVGGLLGILLNMLGFDPPDDEENKFNVSMWKIGSKVGWGDVDENGNHKGIEIQIAWWMNDLTLLSLPIAYLTAGGLSTGDWSLAKDLMLDGLADTVSGNVLLDFAHTVNHWREDYIEFERMSREPDYEGPKDIWSYALMESSMAAWKALGKMNPLDPLVNTFNRDTLFAGEEARNRDFWHVWRRSEDEDLDKFYRENKITEKVSYEEGLRRKYSSSNLIFALVNNVSTGAFTDDKKTSYFWWDMPPRSMGDPLGYAWLGEFYMDLNNIPDDVPGDTRAEKEINFKDMRAKQVLEWIDKFDGAVNQAIDANFTIPEEARKAATNYCFAQISALKADHIAKIESGELILWSEEEREANQKMWDEINNKWNKYIYDWLKNNDIPSYAYTYEQLLTDYDVTYVYRANGKPAPIWASAIPGLTDAVYKPKGNHPTSFAPFTIVDTRNRGYNAETINEWYKEGTTGSDLQWIFDNIGQNEIMFGRDAGKIANDVIFSKQIESGEYKSLEGPPVLGWRSYVSSHNSGVPDSVMEITEENHDGGKLGDAGKYNQDVEDALSGKGKDKDKKTPTYYPRKSYGGGGYSRRSYGGRSGSGDYNPKIYSNPRSVNSDRAATMYTKQPQSAHTTYLRPSFSTKGSREAYKRQDF